MDQETAISKQQELQEENATMLGEDTTSEESIDDVVEDVTNIDDDDDDGEKKKKKKYICGQDLYNVIIKHPDWRVVQHSDSGADSCHPLILEYSHNCFQFKQDASATAMHPHGMCSDILDMIGTDGCPSTMAKAKVKIGDLYLDDWTRDEFFTYVTKIRTNQDAKWIRLYID